ncbi:MAG: signal transduction histidine kinase [Roseivirga sp.]|jgi:signal transduction histidine kinase
MKYRLLLSCFTLVFCLSLNAQENWMNLSEETLEEATLLNGTWNFYWQELIQSEAEAKSKPSLVTVPHDWYNEKPNESSVNFPKQGFATYALNIILPKERPILGLEISQIFSSYNLIVNNELIYKSGLVAKSKEEYMPYREPMVHILDTKNSDTLSILIQAANYDHLNSGIHYGIHLGSYNRLQKQLNSKQSTNMFLAGGLFITGFILLSFSIAFRQLELQVPFYALFSLSLMYRMVGAEPYPLHTLLDHYNFYLAIKLEYGTIHTTALFGGLFIFFLYPKQSNIWIKWIFYIVTSASLLIVLVFPPIVFTAILKYYLFFIIAYVGVFIYILIKAKMAQEYTSGYLIMALAVVMIWTVFQAITFLGLGSVPHAFNVVLVSIIIIACNLALFRTLLLKVNQTKMAEAEIDFQRSRQTMLSLISHEIKMPVATLQMNMEIMKASVNNAEKFDQIKDKLIRLSSEAVDSIKRMLNDFIYFMSVNQELTDYLNIDDIRIFLSQNWSLHLEVQNNEQGKKYQYLTEKITLKYILNTLISNSEKYSERKDKRPELILSQSNDDLIIEIRDYGIGISADELSNLGKPQAKINQNQEISGMGYYLASDLAKRLGHDIWVISRGKEGTSVFIQLKRK